MTRAASAAVAPGAVKAAARPPVTAANDVPIIRPPMFAANDSPVPRRCSGYTRGR
jgi:hypothetical protein